jgi:16S rRNA (cytosine967-C5)-methyltransferase
MPSPGRSIAGSQARVFLELWAELRPRVRRDRALAEAIEERLRRDRRFGSRDRRLYRELIYTTLRFLPWLEDDLAAAPDRALGRLAWLAAEVPATRLFRAAFAGDRPPRPPSVAGLRAAFATEGGAVPGSAGPLADTNASVGRVPDLLPEWFRAECPAAFRAPLEDVLATRPPVWLRLQGGGAEEALAEFEHTGWRATVSPVLPGAVRLDGECDVTRTRAFAEGRIEVQDLGSQLLLAAAGVARGERWLDACAGAGGKTLQLAGLVGPEGAVVAHDVRAEALVELRLRAERGGYANIAVDPRPVGTFDAVLVDAPCSGSGTWRRHPHLKWSTDPVLVRGCAETQLRLLTGFAPRVRSGGRLVYATCSLCRTENAAVVQAFLAASPEYAEEPPRQRFGMPSTPDSAGLTIDPSVHDTDGYYVAVLRRT